MGEDRLMPYPRVLPWSEMQTASFRIWTRISKFITNNRYAKHANVLMQFKIILILISNKSIWLKDLTLLVLYSHLHHHSASQRHNIKDRRMNKRRMIKTQEGRHRKDFFTNIFTSHFIARVWKGCLRFACERVLETEHKLHILTSTTYDRHVMSFLFSWCSTGGLGLTLLDAGFLYGILSASSLDP